MRSDRADQLIVQWFEDYHGRLFRYVLRLLGDEEQAADALQETFERALVALRRQQPPDNPPAWLYRIAANLAHNTLRKRRRWRRLPMLGDERASAFEQQIAQAQLVRDCLARLRPREAEVLLLYDYAGLSCVEIATLSGEQVNAVRQRLYRARLRFAASYEQEIS